MASKKRFLLPNGCLGESVTCLWAGSANVSVDDYGRAESDGLDDRINPDLYECEATKGGFICDDNGNEYAERHCRIVTMDIDGAWYGDEVFEGHKWPPEIVAACARITALSNVVVLGDRMRKWAPTGYFDDTQTAVLDRILVGRAQAEIDALDAEIAAFREGRTEPTKLTEEDLSQDEPAAA